MSDADVNTSVAMSSDSSDEIALKVTEVSLAYRHRAGVFRLESTWALRSVSFELHRGETLGVIGRNGSGKSSLLRLLAGISKPTSGEILATSSFISLLSLNLGFVPNLSGRQNIFLAAMLYGLSREQVVDLFDSIVEYSELDSAIEHPVSTYSAGMKARLGFSIATMVDPDVLLIDEILGVGDLSFRQKSSATMRNRLKSGKTALFVSHNVNEVSALCDRVIWLDNGEVRMTGEPKEIIPQYEECLRQPAP